MSRTVPTICTGVATPAAMRSGMRIAENGGIQLRVVLHEASGSSTEENAAKNIAMMTIISGPDVEFTSSCRETIDPAAA